VHSYPEGTAPSVSLLLQFDQVLALKLLHHHAAWLHSKQLSKARAAWIYALLARLTKPVRVAVSTVISLFSAMLCVDTCIQLMPRNSDGLNVSGSLQYTGQLNLLIACHSVTEALCTCADIVHTYYVP
jgi:Survival motor neuron (SMN) interacting protein 1 (SIP1)